MPPRTSEPSACDRVGKVISRLFGSGSVVSELNGATFDLFPAAIPPPEGEALARWVTRERAEQTIEIGLGHGVAALFACRALLAADAGRVRHVTVDPLQEPWFGDTGLQVLEEAGVIDIVEFHREESLRVLPRLLEQGRRFDLGFVDGDHRFDGVFLDLVYLDRLVRPGGTVFVDDSAAVRDRPRGQLLHHEPGLAGGGAQHRARAAQLDRASHPRPPRRAQLAPPRRFLNAGRVRSDWSGRRSSRVGGRSEPIARHRPAYGSSPSSENPAQCTHPHRVASLVEQPPLALSVAGHSGPDHVWRHEIVQIVHLCVGVVEAEVEEPLV